MKLIVNGEERVMKHDHNVAGFLSEAGYDGMLVAVAINGAFVARGQYSETALSEGDAIEIVAPMQGG